MEKTYNPQTIEQTWYQHWEDQGYFKAGNNGDPYCIVIPPPNVTGSLHMGHAFQDTIMDALIRYHRMQGHNTLWQPGTDHAGIATQMVVERQLSTENKTRQSLGRDRFIERVWQWKRESGDTINQQLRRMGASADWTRARFTMDAGLSKAVQTAFVTLYDEGLIYRGKRLVNWDPTLQTAISELEVLSTEEQGHLWHMRYPIVGEETYLTVATTRPETLFGDTAVAVHPDDPRYAQLIGKQIELPLTSRQIPIIGDIDVDPEFGSGCVKVTPAHDFNDYEIGRRHDLECINVFTPEAKINHQAPEQYRDMDRYAARQQVVKDIEALGLLEKVVDHQLMVPRSDRTQSIVEPYLTNQWFVRVAPLAGPAIQAVKDGQIKFIPENWSKTYFNWMENIQDWCISRQIWWGHRIPAWYDEHGNIYVAPSAKAARSKYHLTDEIALSQDQDVLDTWFSSALWPFSTLGWPDEGSPELQAFYPTSVLVTGFDIIFFWVARMIMFGLKFTRNIPFHQIYIHGLVRDAEGNKMSKSKGNVLDPLDLIDGISLDDLLAKRTTGLMQPDMAIGIASATKKHFPDGIPAYGTDALRFTFAALATTGRDIRFDLGRIQGYRNFCNKLWNATRYVLQNTENQNTEPGATSLAEAWIITRLQQVEQRTVQHFKSYRFDLLARDLYEFVWSDFCDWYIELSKPILYSGQYTEAQQSTVRHTLLTVLETILRLLHPVMPYITEELWQRVAPEAGVNASTIMLCDYPQADIGLINLDAIDAIEWIRQFVIGVRQIRSQMNINPGQAVPLLCQNGSARDRRQIDEHYTLLTALAKLETIDWLTDDAPAPKSAISLLGDMKLLIPLAGLIDQDAELKRLQKKIARAEQDVLRITTKLQNEKFTAKAPPAVVTQERKKLAEAQTALSSLNTQIQQIADVY